MCGGSRMEEKEKIIRIAEDCLELEKDERPELKWLQGIYDRFRMEYSLRGKAEADNLIYEKMYSAIPQKTSDTLKIRFWRTGRHTPTNREQLLSFGKALNMTTEETDYFIKGYYDRSDRIFETESVNDTVYHSRRALLQSLLDEYLKKVHPGRMLQMKISKMTLENNIRHLYYTDALKYIGAYPQRIQSSIDSHITSINYGSELSRNFKLEGEIPRKTMIRHLLILGMPFINRKLMDERLNALGYLPLQEDHTLISGEYMDWLLIRLLDLYSECCTGQEPEQCSRWFQSACRTIDQYFVEKGKMNLRFMYFKALKE